MNSMLLLVIGIVGFGFDSTFAVWQENQTPKKRITQLKDSDIQRFLGNQTDSDHFKLLEQDGDSLLVGAR